MMLEWRPTVLAGVALALSTCAQPRSLANPWFDQGRAAVARAKQLFPAAGRARNVVLFVGDGMDITTVTAARILDGQQRGRSGEENQLSFERLPYVALAKTYTTDQQVPDSAATMTAMVTGVKTKAAVLGVDEHVVRGDYRSVAETRVETLIEAAERRGWSTGIVTTTAVTHATPAAAYAHAPLRTWQSDVSPAAREAGFPDIARQLVEMSVGDGLDVVLGGGRARFLPYGTPGPPPTGIGGLRVDGRDLIADWKRRHPDGAYVTSRGELLELRSEQVSHLLGLFHVGHMSFELDRPRGAAGEPSLAEMTRVALQVLERSSRGFILIVEGGRIDHGHHLGNARRALHDTVAFSEAVSLVLDRVDPQETLVVVTADHGHVLSMGGYVRRGTPILGLVEVDPDYLASVRGLPPPESSQPILARDLTGRPYTVLSYANGPGHTGASDQQPEGPKRFAHEPGSYQPITLGRPQLTPATVADPAYLQESTVPLIRESHGGADVPIYAGGAGAARFHGVQEQSYVYHAIVDALGWSGPPSPGDGAAALTR